MNNEDLTAERPLTCIVVDDEPLAAQLIGGYVRRTPYLRLLGELNSAEDALSLCARTEVDLAFLDIHMPGMGGMELARRLPPATRVVFTTAYADHALEGFDVAALHYLLKPVSFAQFSEAAARAVSALVPPAQPASTTVAGGYLVVKSEYRLVRIPLADIEFIEGLKDYVKIYTSDSPTPILTLMSMKSAEESLPSPAFMRVHRSFIVNLDKVRVVERNCINMHGRAIPVSDTYRRAFTSALGIIL